MAKEKKPEMRYQCLGCYKTHKTEQKALDCCGSMIQAWCINYNKWGKQHWYGRCIPSDPCQSVLIIFRLNQVTFYYSVV